MIIWSRQWNLPCWPFTLAYSGVVSVRLITTQFSLSIPLKLWTFTKSCLFLHHLRTKRIVMTQFLHISRFWGFANFSDWFVEAEHRKSKETLNAIFFKTKIGLCENPLSKVTCFGPEASADDVVLVVSNLQNLQKALKDWWGTTKLRGFKGNMGLPPGHQQGANRRYNFRSQINIINIKAK